jgi:hypothetical protein
LGKAAKQTASVGVAAAVLKSLSWCWRRMHFAVFRLIARMNFVGCSIRESLAFAPLRPRVRMSVNGHLGTHASHKRSALFDHLIGTEQH